MFEPCVPLYVRPRLALGTPPGRAAPTLLRGRPWPDTYPSASFLMFIGTKSGAANPASPSIWAFGDFSGAKRPPRPPARHPQNHLSRGLFSRARATASCGPAGPVLCNRPALYLNRRAARANGPCVASNAASGTPDAGGCAQIGSALRNGIGGGGIRFGPFYAPTLHKK
jgi:hypothetical protein